MTGYDEAWVEASKIVDAAFDAADGHIDYDLQGERVLVEHIAVALRQQKAAV